MQVGTAKDQGLFNKPSAAVHPGALDAGTLPQYNTIQYLCLHTDANAGINFSGSTRRGLNCKGNVPHTIPIFSISNIEDMITQKKLEMVWV